MKIFKTLAAVLALSTAAVAPAHAGLKLNGYQLNGLFANGLLLNGIIINGIIINGIIINGTDATGLKPGAIVAVTLPE